MAVDVSSGQDELRAANQPGRRALLPLCNSSFAPSPSTFSRVQVSAIARLVATSDSMFVDDREFAVRASGCSLSPRSCSALVGVDLLLQLWHHSDLLVGQSVPTFCTMMMSVDHQLPMDIRCWSCDLIYTAFIVVFFAN